LLGVAPRSGHLQGLSDPQHLKDLVFQAALLADPPLVLPLPRLVETQAGRVLHISVPNGLPQVYNLDGRYFGRDGVQTNPLPARKLRQLLVERGVVQFELQTPPQASFEDLDPDKIDAYLKLLDYRGDEPVQQALVRRGCLHQEKGFTDPKPTYAGLLLFGRHPQRWLPGATILAARFSGASFSDRYLKQDITGTLPEQLRQAEAFLRQNLRAVVRLVGLRHEETFEYPLEAIRELLVNAVAHRDYNMQGDIIHLNLFADRIEVHSPGSLPGPVNLENLLQARFSRNAVTVQVLADMGFVERLGYGLDRVVTVMKREGLAPPRFEEVAGSFRVTLYGGDLEQGPQRHPDLTAYQALELNPRQEQALNHLLHHKRITNRDYQELCAEVHPETLRRDLADLVSRGIIIKVGDKRATYYILK
jgi:ATP-dependent DNA helicase RecG